MDKKNIIIFLLIVIIGLLAFLAFWTPEATAPETTIEDIEAEDVVQDNDQTPAVDADEETDEPVADTETDEDVEDPIEEEDEDTTPLVELGSSFTNNPFGYTVAFPENWYWERIDSAFLGPNQRDYLWLDPNSGFIEGSEYGGMMGISVDNRTLADILAERDAQGQQYTTSATTVDGRPATRVTYDVSGGLWDVDESIYVYLENGGYTYSFHMHPPSHDESLFRSVINSFEIIF